MEERAVIYNSSIESAIIINKEQLYSYLIPLLMPGKDHTQIQVYHVITIQDMIGRLLENINARKISNQLESIHLFPPTLGIYRANRDSLDIMKQYLPMVCMRVSTMRHAAAIDLEDVYNRICLGFLMAQLLKSNITSFLLNWISASLFQRKVFGLLNQ